MILCILPPKMISNFYIYWYRKQPFTQIDQNVFIAFWKQTLHLDLGVCCCVLNAHTLVSVCVCGAQWYVTQWYYASLSSNSFSVETLLRPASGTWTSLAAMTTKINVYTSVIAAL